MQSAKLESFEISAPRPAAMYSRLRSSVKATCADKPHTDSAFDRNSLVASVRRFFDEPNDWPHDGAMHCMRALRAFSSM